MRVLLLQHEDFLDSGSWSAQDWDLIVNLGRSPLSHLGQLHNGIPVLHLDDYSQPFSDARIVRDLRHASRGQLIDEHGIDFWELTSIAIVQQAFKVLQLQRLAAEIPRDAELWSTRPHWTIGVLSELLDASVTCFRDGRWIRAKSATQHYWQVLHQFSPSQIKQIVFDKYDAGYRWRSHFSRNQRHGSAPVVLVPSAYTNVSRTAALYAAMLPGLRFLLVATRQSAHECVLPENMEACDLAAYARVQPPSSELASLMEAWTKLRSHLQDLEPLRLLSIAGMLDRIPSLLHSVPFVRNAWRQVLECEPVCSVLCGDDSNFVTSLPVVLAKKRNIPTVDFHHGALDGFYLFKDLPSDLYLAKSEMERDYLLRLCGLPPAKVVIAPPTVRQNVASGSRTRDPRNIVLFSEPYEVAGMHAEDVYGELLPELWRLAQRNRRELVVKLHPFEIRTQRMRVASDVLSEEVFSQIRWLQGPLTSELLEGTWFGITIESTTAIECAQNGVCCFLCRWLKLSPFGYAEQFARFGLGESLQNLQQINEIPHRVEEFGNRRPAQPPVEADPSQLLQWLTSHCREDEKTRSTS